MESLLTELYNVLAQLRYPELAKFDLKDFATTVLTGENRITLLTWLLSRSSQTLSSHLEKFQEKGLKDEVVECYLQMGISIDETTLLGNCSMKQQLSTLKAILLFAKSLDINETLPIDDSVVYELLQKHINETINIVPSSCHVSMKLTDSKAKKYLQEIQTESKDIICLSPAPEPIRPEPSTADDRMGLGSKLEISNGQMASLSSMADAFSRAFDAAEFGKISKSSNLQTGDAVNIDETIQKLYENLSSVAQIFEAKKAISAMEVPKCLEKFETPLSLLIEDNVTFSEQIRNLYDQCHLDN